MAITYELTQGDRDPDMELDLFELGLTEALLDTDVMTLRWTKPDQTTSTVSLVVRDASLGAVVRVWQAGDTDVPGLHQATVVRTKLSGEDETYPCSGTYARWIVNPRLGG